MRLLFASHNDHKTDEIRSIFKASGLDVELISLKNLGDDEEIEESGETLEENALLKSRAGYLRHHMNTFADDTGLEVDALGGRPGVYSARYAGNQACAEDNLKKLLGEMQGVEDRHARFRTVISLIIDGEEYQFEGEVSGDILSECRGGGGFGYDPVFQPNGSALTFAEMSEDAKNAMSHRGRALDNLITFLRTYTK